MKREINRKALLLETRWGEEKNSLGPWKMLGKIWGKWKSPRNFPSTPFSSGPQIPPGNKGPGDEDKEEKGQRKESPVNSSQQYQEFLHQGKEGDLLAVKFSANRQGRDYLCNQDLDINHFNLIQREKGEALVRGHCTSEPLPYSVPLPRDPKNPQQGQNIVLSPGKKPAPDPRAIQEALGQEDIRIRAKVHLPLTEHANSPENQRALMEILARKHRQESLEGSDVSKPRKREKFILQEEDDHHTPDVP